MIKVRIQPRYEKDYSGMAREIKDHIAKGKLPSDATIEDDGFLVTLTYSVPPLDHSRIVNIARYSGEFWLNVELTGLK